MAGVLSRYAIALYDLAAAADETVLVGRDLDALAEVVGGNEELRIHISSPQFTNDTKKRVLAGVLGSEAHDLVRRTVMLLADKGRAGSVGDLAAAYHAVAGSKEGRAVANVTSAVPLNDDVRNKLIQHLQSITGNTVTLEESVDPTLLGGVRIVMGSRMIDGSLRRRLESIGERMARAPLSAATAN